MGWFSRVLFLHETSANCGISPGGGLSGQAMLEALLENKLSPEQVADLARGSLRGKIPRIVEALEGHRMSEHHRLLIRQSLKHMQFIEEMIEELDKQIQERLAPYRKQVELACTVPGIGSDAAAGILAEIGMDMSDNGPFSSCHHLSSWGWRMSRKQQQRR